jgi:hypothetical protein
MTNPSAYRSTARTRGPVFVSDVDARSGTERVRIRLYDLQLGQRTNLDSILDPDVALAPDGYRYYEDSGLHGPARELTDLLHHPNQEDLLDDDGCRPFLNRYLPSRSADAGFGERLRGYVALFPVFWLGILLGDGLRRAETGALQGWLVNELDPNLRLQRYVARGLAWPALDPTGRLSDVAGVTFF